MTEEMKDAIREMQDTEGWSIIESFLKQRMEDHKNQLMHCEVEEIIQHRTSYKAYNSVFLYIREILNHEE